LKFVATDDHSILVSFFWIMVPFAGSENHRRHAIIVLTLFIWLNDPPWLTHGADGLFEVAVMRIVIYAGVSRVIAKQKTSEAKSKIMFWLFFWASLALVGVQDWVRAQVESHYSV
jgi:hypothetical protein